MDERRIGAYGGTFDPFHNAHLEVARAIVRNFALDVLLIIPAHAPPHKQSRSISSAYHRYAMAVLATIHEPHIKVSAMEIDAPDRPYTFETIERLRGVYGSQAQLFFIMGADSFEELDTWRNPEKILGNANLIVATRPGYDVRSSHLPSGIATEVIDLRERASKADFAPFQGYEGNVNHVFITSYVNLDISATEIRQKVRDQKPVEDMVPARVADYIEKYELYRR